MKTKKARSSKRKSLRNKDIEDGIALKQELQALPASVSELAPLHSVAPVANNSSIFKFPYQVLLSFIIIDHDGDFMSMVLGIAIEHWMMIEGESPTVRTTIAKLSRYFARYVSTSYPLANNTNIFPKAEPFRPQYIGVLAHDCCWRSLSNAQHVEQKQ